MSVETNDFDETKSKTNPEIGIGQVIEQITRLNSTSDKHEFIEGYKKVRAQIDIIDQILDCETDNLDELNALDTNELFEILNGLMELGEGNMGVNQLKKSKDIIRILDERLALGHTIDVVE